MTIEKKHACKCANDAKVAQSSCKANVEYGYYSRVLNKPFDSIEELREAEAKHYAELKAKEDKAAAKKADAQKVEDAFKALNQARKTYKEELTQLTEEYSEQLAHIKEAFELGKKDIHNKLAAAEDTYNAALKAFIAAHPEGYHVTLKDGDFETTISGSSKVQNTKKPEVKDPSQVNLFNIFDLLFGL
jgi:chromosome segregation ATPase